MTLSGHQKFRLNLNSITLLWSTYMIDRSITPVQQGSLKESQSISFHESVLRGASPAAYLFTYLCCFPLSLCAPEQHYANQSVWLTPEVTLKQIDTGLGIKIALRSFGCVVWYKPPSSHFFPQVDFWWTCLNFVPESSFAVNDTLGADWMFYLKIRWTSEAKAFYCKGAICLPAWFTWNKYSV